MVGSSLSQGVSGLARPWVMRAFVASPRVGWALPPSNASRAIVMYALWMKRHPPKTRMSAVRTAGVASILYW